MTPQPPQFSIAELGAKFGAQLGLAYAEIITLEKTINALQAQIQEQAKNEARLHDHIQELEAEIAEFTRQEYDFTDHIQALEAELDALKTAEREMVPPHAMPEAPAISSQAKKIIHKVEIESTDKSDQIGPQGVVL